MTSHTPGPWRVNAHHSEQILPPNGKYILAECKETANPYELFANATHIVKCVNAHDDLLAALEKIAAFAPGNGEECEIIAKIARAAIKKATA